MVREDIVFSIENKELIEQNIGAIQELWKEYGKVKAAALKEYEKVEAAAWKEYDKVKAPAWKEYEKVSEKAFNDFLQEVIKLLKETEK